MNYIVYYSFTHRELYYSGTTLFHLPNLSLINGNLALGGTRMPVFKFYYYIFSSNSFWLLINTLMENIMIIKCHYLIYIKHLVLLWLLMKTTLIYNIMIFKYNKKAFRVPIFKFYKCFLYLLFVLVVQQWVLYSLSIKYFLNSMRVYWLLSGFIRPIFLF